MSGVVSAVSLGVAAGVGASALGATALTAGLIGAGIGVVGGVASSMLGNQSVNMPDVNTVINPAAQSALASRADTGASVKLGSTVKDQRVSGARTSSGGTRASTVDILGGLGGGGGGLSV